MHYEKENYLSCDFNQEFSLMKAIKQNWTGKLPEPLSSHLKSMTGVAVCNRQMQDSKMNVFEI